MESNRTPPTQFGPDKLKPPLINHTEGGKKLIQIVQQLTKEGKAATRENFSSLAHIMGADPKIIKCAVYDDEDFCDDQNRGFDTYEKLSSPDPVFLDDNPAIKIPHDVFPAAIGEMVEATSKATETPCPPAASALR